MHDNKITYRYSFGVLDFYCNGFGFINKTWVGYLFIYDINGLSPLNLVFCMGSVKMTFILNS